MELENYPNSFPPDCPGSHTSLARFREMLCPEVSKEGLGSRPAPAGQRRGQQLQPLLAPVGQTPLASPSRHP